VEPDEMGVGPVAAVPRLLERHGLKIDEIDLWELNEAYAVQVIIVATSWASIRKNSTSTAARFQWATPMG
jgi:acetyl-CoA acetyltransferase